MAAKTRSLRWAKLRPVIFIVATISTAAIPLVLFRNHLKIGIPIAVLCVLLPLPGHLLLRLGDHVFIEKPILKASRL